MPTSETAQAASIAVDAGDDWICKMVQALVQTFIQTEEKKLTWQRKFSLRQSRREESKLGHKHDVLPYPSSLTHSYSVQCQNQRMEFRFRQL
eukprot:1144447-Pelagomonas_calceolata.AAC.2